MYVEELVAWAEAEANSPYLRSPPLKSRPFRNDMKGKVGTHDLVLMCFDLENDSINDATKILEGMSEDKNDANKSVEFNQGVHGSVDGMSE
nr:transposase, MuDR, MULE transposase domain protein [Tanacetum cinerariifolium]